MKLAVLVGVMIALPILLYGQFEGADRKARLLVANGLRRESLLIAQGLTPVLDAPGGLPRDPNRELAKFGGDGTALKLMLAPRGQQSRAFYYVAAAPAADPVQLNQELEKLNHNGILRQLEPRCAEQTAAEIRNGLPGAENEILTSIVPIKSRWGCWILVSSHAASQFVNISVGEPYWKSPQMRLAGLIYAVMTLVGCFIAWSVWRAVRRFRRAAHAVRRGQGHERSFSQQNDIPELAPVAADFDALVSGLHKAAQDIRRRSEDNAHALKTPLATIRSSVSVLRRAMDPADGRGREAITLIESSTSRLNTLILAAQRTDKATADSMEGPRLLDLRVLVRRVVAGFRAAANPRGIDIQMHARDAAWVRASEAALEAAIENIIDNAIGFSPDDGVIAVDLSLAGGRVTLTVCDQGPGVEADLIGKVFDRYCSSRGNSQMQEPHSGLGLWIVRHNVEAAGGSVSAANLEKGGFCVSILLPGGPSLV